ncbi:hypothetical protein [Gracilimonas mengyeensis]|uniref:HEPN domain-containing protein n=1 Tax=Gracilimonas mengyeensis TaxID=1302730 RepID=A0A521C1J7_9BACT|nr:hypothetical protein [Gracilimonas mengyeensis]SMO53258.1 hypothetical protein SAMN06265219_10485 [Gracilimonas mengyeensis]
MDNELIHAEIEILVLAEDSLSLASNLANLILERNLYHTGEIKEGYDCLAYTTSFIVTYARPFFNNYGYNDFPEELLRELNSHQIVLHDELKEMRKKVIAHVDSTHTKFSLGQINNEEFPKINSPSFIHFGIEKSKMIDYQKLISTLRTSIQIKYESLKKKLD